MPGIAVFDVLLVIVLPLLAWWVMAGPDLFKSVILFIVFGLLLALAWVRLRAPDVALAEAAIGAGLTGALLLDTLGRLRTRDRINHDERDNQDGNTAGDGNSSA